MDGMVNAVVRAQAQGYLIKQNYREGDFVRKRQILFEIVGFFLVKNLFF